MYKHIFFQISMLLLPCYSHAGVMCNGKIVAGTNGNKVAEVRCTHDGGGASVYKCTVSWKLRNVKGGEAALSGNCGVLKGEKDKFCWSNEEVLDEKIKEAVGSTVTKCDPS